MIKYLLILINSLSLFIYSFFGGEGGISVTSNIPKSIMPGKEVPVEVKIAKGNQSGFAKMQMELPAGLTVKEGDNQGANFTFTDGIVKWVWASLPMESDIIIKFTLVADASASGAKTITGKYSYVENNAKQVVEMAPVEVTIGSEQQAGAAANTQTTSPETKTTAPTSTTTTTEVTTTGTPSTTINPNAEPSGNVSVTRTVTKGNSEGEYLISLKVKKGSTKGFARYSDDLPSDLTAKAVKTEGASFSVSDGKIKFVWVTVPEKDELDISYTITGVNRTINLGGEYSYLEQNQSKMFMLPVEPITLIQGQITETPTTQPTNTVAATPTTEPTNTVAANTKTETTVPVPQPTETPVSMPQPTETLTKKEGNINYMVQIGAFTNSAVGVNTLSKKFSITEKISSEMQSGFNKFMVGDHQEYKGARDHREKVRDINKVTSAFVVAYNTGKRITVQEALMISNQKWYK